jgi:excisionase family DNA binding protein
MNTKRQKFLSLRTFPGRLSTREVAWYLGFAADEIPILVAIGMLKPLGSRPTNGVNFFATAILDDLRKDLQWLARASGAVCQHWQERSEQPSELKTGHRSKTSEYQLTSMAGSMMQAASDQHQNQRGQKLTETPTKPGEATGKTERLAYSIEEAAAMIGVHYFSIYRLIQRGKLKACRALRGKFLVPHSELVKLMKCQ